ncbi:hypothetical protein [Acrocarpospora macrocephala]|nr:hypothetical protein [Acrocarpospora macrocephala]
MAFGGPPRRNMRFPRRPWWQSAALVLVVFAVVTTVAVLAQLSV